MFGRIFTFNRILYLLLLGIFLNLVYISYFLFYPFKTITFNNEPFPIVNTQPVKPGDALLYKVNYCRYTDKPSHVTRTIIGPTVITVAQDIGVSSVGCREIMTSNVILPSYIPDGEYYLKLDICNQVNPLRDICKQVQTQKFEVKR